MTNKIRPPFGKLVVDNCCVEEGFLNSVLIYEGEDKTWDERRLIFASYGETEDQAFQYAKTLVDFFNRYGEMVLDMDKIQEILDNYDRLKKSMDKIQEILNSNPPSPPWSSIHQMVEMLTAIRHIVDSSTVGLHSAKTPK